MIAIFPELTSAAAQGKIEELAILARRYFGEEDARQPKLDVRQLAARAGIAVIKSPLDPYAAIAVEDEGGRFRIVLVVRQALSYEEERFLLAHCLGHILLEIHPLIAKGQVGKLGFKEIGSPAQRFSHGSGGVPPGTLSDPETRADHFAAALLMPHGMVMRAYEKIQNLDATAKFFGVDRAVLGARIQGLQQAAGVRSADGGPASFLDGERQIFGKVLDPVGSSDRPLDLRELKSPILQDRPTQRQTLVRSQDVATAPAAGKIISAPLVDPAPAPAVLDPSRRPAVDRKKSMAKSTVADGSKSSPGLSKLRQLAKMIDESVEL